jgi:hypothetical protein
VDGLTKWRDLYVRKRRVAGVLMKRKPLDDASLMFLLINYLI